MVHESMKWTQVVRSRIQQQVLVGKEMKIQVTYKGSNIFD